MREADDGIGWAPSPGWLEQPWRLLYGGLMRVVERVGSAAGVVAVGIVALLAVGLTGAAAGPPGSPDLLSVDGQDVTSFDVSPDGTRVRYLHQSGMAVIAADGGAQLTSTLPRVAMTFTPDSQHLVYTADTLVPGRSELFVTTIASDETTRISQAMQHADGDVAGWVVSPDSQTVIYQADPVVEDDFDLFALPIGGGTPTTLSTLPVQALAIAGDSNISPDSSTVVFIVETGDAADRGLYSVPIDGSADPTRISDGSQHGAVQDWKISPDSQHVIYQARRSGAGTPRDTYSVPIGGGTPVLLHPGEVDGFVVAPDSFQITADSTRVVLSVAATPASNAALFSIPIAGGTATDLNQFGPDGDVGGFALTPDSAHVVYSVGGLYRVPVIGGAPVELTASTPSLDRIERWVLMPDGEYLVYRITETFTEASRLYGIAVQGGTPELLSTALADPDEPGRLEPLFLVSPDGGLVIFESDSLDFTSHLYATALPGGSPVRLNDSQTADRITGYGFAGSDTVLLVSDGANEFNDEQLFSVDVSGIDPPPPTPVPTATAAPTSTPTPTPTPIAAPTPTPTPTPRPDGCTIVGTEGDDVLVGTAGPDVICGFGGDDVLHGRGGADVLKGGSGDDELRGGSGGDRLFGGPGADELRGQRGPDELRGGKGADRLLGGSGRDNLLGQSGGDFLSGGSAPDRLRGGTGRDTLDGGTGRDDVKGGPGVDLVIG